MQKNIVYVVVKEEELVFVSSDLEEANDYKMNDSIEATADVLEEWDNDDPSEEDIVAASFQAGYDGDNCEIFSVDISKYVKGDTVELDDGSEVDYNKIVKLLKENEFEGF